MGEQLIGETDYDLCCSVRAVEEGKHREAKLMISVWAVVATRHWSHG